MWAERRRRRRLPILSDVRQTFFFVGKVILYGFMCYLTLYYADLKVLQILGLINTFISAFNHKINFLLNLIGIFCGHIKIDNLYNTVFLQFLFFFFLFCLLLFHLLLLLLLIHLFL